MRISFGYQTSHGPGSSIGIHWTVRNRIPVGTRFSARPGRPWDPPSLLYNGYRVFPAGKVRPGRAADHFWCRGHGRIELYLYPPSRPHRACNGITLPYQKSREAQSRGAFPILYQIKTMNKRRWQMRRYNKKYPTFAFGRAKNGLNLQN